MSDAEFRAWSRELPKVVPPSLHGGKRCSTAALTLFDMEFRSAKRQVHGRARAGFGVPHDPTPRARNWNRAKSTPRWASSASARRTSAPSALTRAARVWSRRSSTSLTRSASTPLPGRRSCNTFGTHPDAPSAGGLRSCERSARPAVPTDATRARCSRRRSRRRSAPSSFRADNAARTYSPDTPSLRV